MAEDSLLTVLSTPSPPHLPPPTVAENLDPSKEQIMMLNNGCLCCTVRDDLVGMLEQLVGLKGRHCLLSGTACCLLGLRIVGGLGLHRTQWPRGCLQVLAFLEACCGEWRTP